MKVPLLVVMLIATSIPAVATEFRLTGGEIGPIVVSMEVHIRNEKDKLVAEPRQIAEFTATARNESDQAIRYAKFCVQAGRRTKGCDFEFWSNQVWLPGEELLWMIDKHARPGIDMIGSAMILKLKIVRK